MVKVIYKILFLSIIVIFIFSCAKSKENKLIGIWTLVDYNNPQNDKTTWEFKSDGTLWIKNDSVFVDTAEYDFQTESMRYYVDIVGMGLKNVYDGKYHIDKLTKDLLMIQSQNPFYRYEFIK